MRKTLIGLAVRAVILAGSFASIAQAANLERDHRNDVSDRVAYETIAPQAQAGSAIFELASLERDNAQEKADL